MFTEQQQKSSTGQVNTGTDPQKTRLKREQGLFPGIQKTRECSPKRDTKKRRKKNWNNKGKEGLPIRKGRWATMRLQTE